ncbi:MAG TPA: L-threonylcarbamoyladenylate synthase [Candidatus Chromulinivoraceae bacterium]|nr:L-threonylcarbamoyladenylate synthase [Candidatus Chromulinivoraceae bacterium]
MNEKIVSIDQAIDLLNQGAVGVMPTDTVYGVVSRATDQSAVRRMYALKSRERKPGTLIAATTRQLRSLSVPQVEIDKVKRWWPNPLSAVLIMNGNEYLHQGVGDIAMRVVANPGIKRVLEQTGPLITSSANLPGKPGATTVAEAYTYFGDAVDFYVDGGRIADALPSTIIRPRGDVIDILRQGSVTL